jgi:gluconokinase
MSAVGPQARDRRVDDQPANVTVVLMGVSGSGKSTLMARMVERLGWTSTEADDFHPAANVATMASGHPLTDEDRWPWLRALAAWIGQREAAGENAVVTCSALRRAYRDLLRDGHPSVLFVHLVVDPGVLEQRMKQRRGHYMPPSLLGSQLETLEPLRSDEPGFVVSGELPPDEIIDDIEARVRSRSSRRRSNGVDSDSRTPTAERSSAE